MTPIRNCCSGTAAYDGRHVSGDQMDSRGHVDSIRAKIDFGDLPDGLDHLSWSELRVKPHPGFRHVPEAELVRHSVSQHAG